MKKSHFCALGVLIYVASVTIGLLAGATLQAAAASGAPVPTNDELLALEHQAHQAYFKGDAKFFEGLLHDKFVMLAPDGSRMDKAATTKWIAGVRCDVKDGWTLDEPQVSTVDGHTYVFSHRGTFDGTCTADGTTVKVPSPVRSATVWVRSGDTWQAAFHGENPIIDPAAPAAQDAHQSPPQAGKRSVPTIKPAPPADDATTAELLALEQSVWEAWMMRDAAKLNVLMADDITFVDVFGNVTTTKPQTLKLWTQHSYDIKAVRVTDGAVTMLSPHVCILNFKGTAEGTINGNELPPIFGTSVYVKYGKNWQVAFTMNRLPG